MGWKKKNITSTVFRNCIIKFKLRTDWNFKSKGTQALMINLSLLKLNNSMHYINGILKNILSENQI